MGFDYIPTLYPISPPIGSKAKPTMRIKRLKRDDILNTILALEIVFSFMLENILLFFIVYTNDCEHNQCKMLFVIMNVG
jgi:hypothetical protein